MNNDYKFLNLNMFMQPENSPITQTSGRVSAYDFDWINERGAITTSMVKSLTADRITSGTVDASIITVSNISANNITSGTMSGTTVTMDDLDPNNLTAGTVAVAINLGTSASGSVILDGVNNRIIVHDGTTNRIVIGNI